MIIFNQHEQYENLIKNGFEKYPNFRDLMILAKEWKFVENMEPKDIKTRLIGFCNSKVDNFDEAKSQELIKNVIEKLKKTQNYTELPLKLVFFKGELDQILQVVNKEWRKIIFIFLRYYSITERQNLQELSGNFCRFVKTLSNCLK